MNIDLALFMRALGLAIVFEGLLWAIFPGGMRRALLSLMPMPVSRLRILGLAAMGVGLVLISLVS